MLAVMGRIDVAAAAIIGDAAFADARLADAPIRGRKEPVVLYSLAASIPENTEASEESP
jgi:hypothetical protein